jgi:hypothetical protein
MASGFLGSRNTSNSALLTSNANITINATDNTITSVDTDTLTVLKRVKKGDFLNVTNGLANNNLVSTEVTESSDGVITVAGDLVTNQKEIVGPIHTVLYFDGSDNSINTSNTEVIDLSVFGVGQDIAISGASLSALNGTRTVATSTSTKLTFNPTSNTSVTDNLVFFRGTDNSLNSDTGGPDLSVFPEGETITIAGTTDNNNGSYVVLSSTATKVVLGSGTVSDTGFTLSNSAVIRFLTAGVGDDYIESTNTSVVNFLTQYGFAVGQTITVSGSTNNEGVKTITNVTADRIYVSETLVDESAGTYTLTPADSVGIDGVGSIINTGQAATGTIALDDTAQTATTSDLDFVALGYTVGQEVSFIGSNNNDGQNFVVSEVTETVLTFDGTPAIVAGDSTAASIEVKTSDFLTLANATPTTIEFDTVGRHIYIYEAPALTYTVGIVNAVNKSDEDAKVDIAISEGATGVPDDADFIEYGLTIAPSGVLERTGIVLDNGKKLWVKSTIADVSFSIFGLESSQ